MKRRSRRFAFSVIAIGVVVLIVLVSIGTYVVTKRHHQNGQNAGSAPQPVAPYVAVSGNQLVNSSGKPARFVGVDLSGSKQCLFKFTQPFPAPADSSTVAALESWHINAVRMTLNESCWLGVDGEPHSISSAQYRKSVESFVSLLNAAHFEIIITMYADTDVVSTKTVGTKVEKKQTVTSDPMPDSTYGPEFWTSIATTFRGMAGVIFDLYNEPHNKLSWACWENGCKILGTQYVGMQQLIDAVRATGARQPLMLGGIDLAENLSGWLSHEPHDPDHDLIASFHVYARDSCDSAKCWNTTVAPLAKHVPVIAGEVGSNTCSTSFLQSFMKWSDKHGISYLAWAWITGGCTTGGPLLADYSGTPSSYGSFFKSHVDALFAAGKIPLGGVSIQS
jgi:endoglucanase